MNDFLTVVVAEEKMDRPEREREREREKKMKKRVSEKDSSI